jgi:VWFA-related protein
MTRVVLLAAVFALTAAPQEDTPLFHANSELVMLDVEVLHNKTNAPMAQLKAPDFQLSEDGTPQQITYFGRDDLPLSIVLLFDLTQSVHGVLPHLAKGAQTALDHLKPEDEVAVMTYAASANLVDGFTRDHARTAAAVGKAARMKSADAAFFNEAVYQASAQLERSTNPSARRVILWLTDNFANVPDTSRFQGHVKGLSGALPHTEEEAIRKLHEAGAVVMPILLKDRMAEWWIQMVMVSEAPYRKKYPPGDANKYAELSGGFSSSLRGKDVDERLAQDIDDLRARYTIGYRPADDKPAGTFCHVKVTLAPGAPLHPEEWRVLARDGYYRK